MKDTRPINLSLSTIKFPIIAIASILHRISGVILFLLIPLFLWGLDLSLSGQADFARLTTYLENGWLRFIIWGLSVALIYHIIAGLKHLVMDMGHFEALGSAKCMSIIAIVATMIVAVFLGVALWV